MAQPRGWHVLLTYIGKKIFLSESARPKPLIYGIYVAVPRGPLTSVQIMPLGWKETLPRWGWGWGWDGVTCFTYSKKPLAMIRPRTVKLIGRMDLKSRWPLSQRSRSPWPLVPEKLIILQCLWLGPSYLEEMSVLTSKWSWGQRSPGSLVLKCLITWQCLELGPSNLEGMLILTSRWHPGQRLWSRSPWPSVLKR